MIPFRQLSECKLFLSKFDSRDDMFQVFFVYYERHFQCDSHNI